MRHLESYIEICEKIVVSRLYLIEENRSDESMNSRSPKLDFREILKSKCKWVKLHANAKNSTKNYSRNTCTVYDSRLSLTKCEQVNEAH